MKKHILVCTLMVFLAFAGSLASAQPDKPFPDVPKDHWAYQAVMELKQKGILLGYPDGTFNGKKTMGKQPRNISAQKRMEELQRTEGRLFGFEVTPAVYLAYKDLRDAAVLGQPNGPDNGAGPIIGRYQLAIVIKRAVEGLYKADPGDGGKAKIALKQGMPEPSLSKITPKQRQELLLLVSAFKGELTSLGTDVRRITSRLEKLKTE